MKEENNSSLLAPNSSLIIPLPPRNDTEAETFALRAYPAALFPAPVFAGGVAPLSKNREKAAENGAFSLLDDDMEAPEDTDADEARKEDTP